jgi:F420-0:gamma-glutamyl ligase
MALYFEAAVRYEKMLENGSVKRVTEKYIVDALSFAEAEARAIDNITPHISGDVEVRAVKRTPIAEIMEADADRYFLAKVAFITLDERSGVEKKSVSQMLVGGSDYDEAKANLEDAMKGTVSDYELQSLSETGIVDVFLHVAS